MPWVSNLVKAAWKPEIADGFRTTSSGSLPGVFTRPVLGPTELRGSVLMRLSRPALGVPSKLKVMLKQIGITPCRLVSLPPLTR